MSNILTLRIDPAAQAHFEALRQQHFPPERNRIPAHISLFHTLPEDSDDSALARIAAAQPTFPLAVTGLRPLGRGVAYTLRSPTLQALHARLAGNFRPHLTPQDLQPFRPHIVVQNKSTPELARALLADLERTFHAMELTALGLDLWRYLGGPWQHLRTFPFAPAALTDDPSSRPPTLTS